MAKANDLLSFLDEKTQHKKEKHHDYEDAEHKEKFRAKLKRIALAAARGAGHVAGGTARAAKRVGHSVTSLPREIGRQEMDQFRRSLLR